MTGTTTQAACPHCRTMVLTGAERCVACGRDLRTGEGAEPAPSQERRQFTSTPDAAALLGPRISMSALLGLGATIAALTLLAVTLVVVRSVAFGPDDAVRAYFAALQNRDADRALQVLSGPSQSELLLQTSTLRSSGFTPPQSVRLQGVRNSSEQEASATVAFNVDGVDHKAQLSLRREGKAPLRFFPRWHITNGTHPATVVWRHSDTLTIAGQSVALNGGQYSGQAFLGTYSVRVPAHPLFEAPDTTIVQAASDTTITPAAQVKPSALEAVKAQVASYLEQCRQTRSLQTEGCPFGSTTSTGDVPRPVWRINRQPTYKLVVEEDQVVVVTITPGVATVTGREVDTFSGTSAPFSDSVPFSVDGTVSADSGAVTYTPGGHQ